ncbi:hypothetical protein SAMN05421505_11950 [Sinosporangium album]|uniref:Uncharacterized protein n=1 Tax=Sinosporangium album TaxID=504805 RepID=A0A1G8DZF5_9ACTN|nr:hypothetical protein [Sinosporangium album]SDH62829.1 hypothetical protein SAMN05421505_11950 [Sinosporangium album]
MDGYWESIAIAAPVIGLAIVVELRLLQAEWQKSRCTPRLQMTLAAPFIAYLFCAAFVEYEALVQLRSEPMTRAWASFAEFTLGAGLAVLVVGPVSTHLLRLPAVLTVLRYALTPWRTITHMRLRQLLKHHADRHLRLRISIREGEMAASLHELRIAHLQLLEPGRSVPRDLLDQRESLNGYVTDETSALRELERKTRGVEERIVRLRRDLRRATHEPASAGRRGLARPSNRRPSAAGVASGRLSEPDWAWRPAA